MELSTTDSIASIKAEEWNLLAAGSDSNFTFETINPLVQHDFLLALEQHECLHPYGWYPNHLLVHDNGKLIAAAPAYVKTNSYGEFVFDWAWADAYQRYGKPYYPKLVCAVPYTPANGPRLLVHPDYPHDKLASLLIEFSKTVVEKLKLSTAHYLFAPQHDINLMKQHGFIERIDCQFHWRNQQYENFDHYLSFFKRKKRKNINQERRKIRDANIDIQRIPGDQLSDEQWQKLYDFYQITFMKKSGSATLTLDFFKAIKHKVLAILATHNNDYVAGAICLVGNNALYGRHWGCYQDFDSLHFELCYYQGIEYCIENKLELFEPGAQGEHKIQRGFLPVITRSAHWIADNEFRELIAQHTEREHQHMEMYYQDLSEASPFKDDAMPLNND